MTKLSIDFNDGSARRNPRGRDYGPRMNNSRHPAGKRYRQNRDYKAPNKKYKKDNKACGYCELSGRARDSCPIRAQRQLPEAKIPVPEGRGAGGSLSRSQHVVLYKSGMVACVLGEKVAAAVPAVAEKATAPD